MTIDELRNRVRELEQTSAQTAMNHNMVLGRLQEAMERLNLAEAREKEVAETKPVAKATKARAAKKPDAPKAAPVAKSKARSKTKAKTPEKEAVAA